MKLTRENEQNGNVQRTREMIKWEQKMEIGGGQNKQRRPNCVDVLAQVRWVA